MSGPGVEAPGSAPRDTAHAPAAPGSSLAGLPTRRTAAQVAKDIALFFAAPFVTMAYLATFPVLAVLLLVRTARENRQRAG